MNFDHIYVGLFALAAFCCVPSYGQRRNTQSQVERNSNNIRYIFTEILALRDDIQVVHEVLNKTCAIDEGLHSAVKEISKDINTESERGSDKSEVLTKVNFQMKYVLNGVKDEKHAAHESLKEIREDQMYVLNRTEHIENNVKDLEVQIHALHSKALHQADQAKSELIHITDALDNETHEIRQDLQNLDNSTSNLKSKFESFEVKSKTLYLDTQSLKDDVKKLQVKDTSIEDTVKMIQDELAALKTITMNIPLETMGWKYFHGSYYKLFMKEVDFGTASAFCEKQNGYLASITSQKENNFVAGMIASSKNNAWLGGNDKALEGYWQWASYEHFNYNRWSTREPNNVGNDEDCISMYFHNGKWNDMPCSVEIHYVCEIRD